MISDDIDQWVKEVGERTATEWDALHRRITELEDAGWRVAHTEGPDRDAAVEELVTTLLRDQP